MPYTLVKDREIPTVRIDRLHRIRTDALANYKTVTAQV